MHFNMVLRVFDLKWKKIQSMVLTAEVACFVIQNPKIYDLKCRKTVKTRKALCRTHTSAKTQQSPCGTSVKENIVYIHLWIVTKFKWFFLGPCSILLPSFVEIHSEVKRTVAKT